MTVTGQAKKVELEFTVFMLLKADPDRMDSSVARARKRAQEALAPILLKHSSKVMLGYFDVDYYSARVTDIWIWRAKDDQAFRHLLADLRKNPFWHCHFRIVEDLRAWSRHMPGITMAR